MKTLALHSIDKVDHLVQPEEFQEVTLHSSALDIFTDFKKHRALMIDANTLAVEAEQEMIRSHVKMKLVVDEDKEFVGLISFDDIASQNIVKLVANGYQRSELTVADLMTPRSMIKALNYEDVAHANIANLIDTLQLNGVQHCLVVDSEKHHIRGVISASDIARKLKLSISVNKAPSFVDIFRVIRGSF
ncbi:CBS domain-containing protein [Catenovulum sp. 2E275]|uniref:CBS domain-containing protein n=1 Tax=Catenovulum sp. 2E275 TaxID=2980497 RepID=UPI0021CF9AA3|nr:CBS domain-containing protein [Catenovulum sp. 2E275]MCU4676117.1 CBS domain-containing protein [Catenovulum sp. 2E275]